MISSLQWHRFYFLVSNFILQRTMHADSYVLSSTIKKAARKVWFILLNRKKKKLKVDLYSVPGSLYLKNIHFLTPSASPMSSRHSKSSCLWLTINTRSWLPKPVQTQSSGSSHCQCCLVQMSTLSLHVCCSCWRCWKALWVMLRAGWTFLRLGSPIRDSPHNPK